MTVAKALNRRPVDAIASLPALTAATVRRRLFEAHGKTLIRNAFYDRWPGNEDLGEAAPRLRDSRWTKRYRARLKAAKSRKRGRIRVDRIVGLAGLHRLLAHLDLLRAAAVLIVVAGMDGALPSVVAGLVAAPVIAVPTSVGYGASFDGLAALLGMMTSCAPGITVVNIDNGFGAAYAASVINGASGRSRSQT